MADPMSTLLIFLAVVLGGVLLLWRKNHSSGRQQASKFGARLPKGSLGWPIIGDSLAFLRDPAEFGSSRVRRYGNIFMSSIYLRRVIVGTTPEFAKFVITSKDIICSTDGIPAGAAKLLGPKSNNFRDGREHMSVKRLLQKPLLPDALRTQLNLLETIVCENLASWEQRGTIIGIEGTRKIVFDIAMWFLLGVIDIGSTPDGRKAQKDFEYLKKALGVVPLNLPGTAYNKGVKAKADLAAYFKHLVEMRKGQVNNQTDVLGVLLAARENPEALEEVKDLDNEMIADNLVFLWFAATETTTTTLTWILKFLLDNPDVLRRVQAEQQEILRSKGLSAEGPRLSWDDTKKMVYTEKFSQEVQRILAIIPNVVRQPTEDIEFEGYRIPKGWALWPLHKFIHSDPAIYPNPERFDPSRFDAVPKPYTYLPFSAGSHMCPGKDLAKLTVLVFVHHLTTSYRYERAAPERGLKYTAGMPAIVGGYPISIYRQS